MDKNQTEKKPPLLETKGVTKKFGNFVANEKIDLIVERGEVHAILGENGAGKSVLMKTLYGFYPIDEGAVYMEGKEVVMNPPSAARALGISMVFQDFRLVTALTVFDNIVLAVVTKGFFIKNKELRERILECSKRYDLTVDLDAYIWELDFGQRQRVEILKVLLIETTRVIIFDEPTSVLAPSEVQAFLDMVGRLRADNFGILMITHKFAEVMAVADRATVLRLGKVVFTAKGRENFNEKLLIGKMMGDKVCAEVNKTYRKAREDQPLLVAKDLTITNNHGQVVLDHINFSIFKGEVVGLAGISGNGQKEMVEAFYGLRKPTEGSLMINQHPMPGGKAIDFIGEGICMVSDDPGKESVIPGLSILEHMILVGLPVVAKGLGIDWDKVKEELLSHEEVGKVGLQDSARRADQLSGGNLQKMVMLRALLHRPNILLASYPSKGLDIGTTRMLQNYMLSLAEKDSSVMLISEDLSEIFSLSDRIFVLNHHHLFGPFDPKQTDVQTIGKVMLSGGAVL